MTAPANQPGAAAAVVVVTGAASGIGRATATRIQRAGRQVVAADRDKDGLRDLATEAPGITVLEADLTRSQDVDLVFHCADALGPLAGLAHVAGVDPHPEVKRRAGLQRDEIARGSRLGLEMTTALDRAEWDRVIEVNLTAAFLVVRAALSSMVPRGQGSIVTVASVAGVSGSLSTSAHYAASKAGLIGFTQSVACEVAPHGVLINTVAPGPVNTPMHARTPGAADRDARLPIGRAAEADEVAAVIEFLLGPGASYLVGETINVNGGMLIV